MGAVVVLMMVDVSVVVTVVILTLISPSRIIFVKGIEVFLPCCRDDFYWGTYDVAFIWGCNSLYFFIVRYHEILKIFNGLRSGTLTLSDL